MPKSKSFKPILISSLLLMGLFFAFGGIRHYLRYTMVNARYAPAPKGMVFVPAGEFVMGSNDPAAEGDEQPERSRFVKAFYIDQHEITNKEYKIAYPSHSFIAGTEFHPVTGILRKEAEQYCEYYGERLPTNEEWEKAARGVDGRIFPWGNELGENNANFRIPPRTPALASVGSFPKGASPYGCQDMAGNAWEWVRDNYFDKSAFGFRVGFPRGIVRGGAFRYSEFQCRTSYQGFEDPELTCNDIGFRCAMSAEPQKTD